MVVAKAKLEQLLTLKAEAEKKRAMNPLQLRALTTNDADWTRVGVIKQK